MFLTHEENYDLKINQQPDNIFQILN
jgi:hypothetical protein